MTIFLLYAKVHNGTHWTRQTMGWTNSFEEALTWKRVNDEKRGFEEVQEINHKRRSK